MAYYIGHIAQEPPYLRTRSPAGTLCVLSVAVESAQEGYLPSFNHYYLSKALRARSLFQGRHTRALVAPEQLVGPNWLKLAFRNRVPRPRAQLGEERADRARTSSGPKTRPPPPTNRHHHHLDPSLEFWRLVGTDQPGLGLLGEARPLWGRLPEGRLLLATSFPSVQQSLPQYLCIFIDRLLLVRQEDTTER